MTCAEHEWQPVPSESSWNTARYRCKCGTWGYRQFSKGKRGAEILAYKNGYAPTGQEPTAMPVDEALRQSPAIPERFSDDRWRGPCGDVE